MHVILFILIRNIVESFTELGPYLIYSLTLHILYPDLISLVDQET